MISGFDKAFPLILGSGDEANRSLLFEQLARELPIVGHRANLSPFYHD